MQHVTHSDSSRRTVQWRFCQSEGWKVAYVEAHVPDEQSAGGGGGGGLGGGGGMQWNVGSWRITPDSQ